MLRASHFGNSFNIHNPDQNFHFPDKGQPNNAIFAINKNENKLCVVTQKPDQKFETDLTKIVNWAEKHIFADHIAYRFQIQNDPIKDQNRIDIVDGRIEQLNTLIRQHNKHVDENWCITALNILFLILTLGIFHFRNTYYLAKLSLLSDSLRQLGILDNRPSQTTEPMGKVVGKLHEKWQFPSDHVPIGARVGGLNIASYNVLNTRYLENRDESFVYQDSQGLNGSMITELNKKDDTATLTHRDEIVFGQVAFLMQQFDVLALQECSPAFVAFLKEMYGSSHFGIIERMQHFTESGKDPEQGTDGNVILYNKEKFTLQNVPGLENADRSVFAKSKVKDSKKERDNPLVTAVLQNNANGLTYRFVNAHLPGNKRLNGHDSFTQHLQKQRNEGETLIALGDMNFNEVEMDDAIARNMKMKQGEYSRVSPYPTIVEPKTLRSQAIDHIFVFSKDVQAQAMAPEQVLPDLDKTVNLLR